MIILRCVICDSERAFYGRSVNVASGVRCADCGGCSWEVLMDDGDGVDGPAVALSAAEIRQAATRPSPGESGYGGYYTWAHGSMGEYLDE